MFQRLTPFAILVFMATAGLAAASLVLLTALSQPWLGVGLVVEAESGLVRIGEVASDGPAKELVPGTPLTKIGGIAIGAADLVEEPDVAESYVAL